MAECTASDGSRAHDGESPLSECGGLASETTGNSKAASPEGPDGVLDDGNVHQNVLNDTVGSGAEHYKEQDGLEDDGIEHHDELDGAGDEGTVRHKGRGGPGGDDIVHHDELGGADDGVTDHCKLQDDPGVHRGSASRRCFVGNLSYKTAWQDM